MADLGPLGWRALIELLRTPLHRLALHLQSSHRPAQHAHHWTPAWTAQRAHQQRVLRRSDCRSVSLPQGALRCITLKDWPTDRPEKEQVGVNARQLWSEHFDGRARDGLPTRGVSCFDWTLRRANKVVANKARWARWRFGETNRLYRRTPRGVGRRVERLLWPHGMLAAGAPMGWFGG